MALPSPRLVLALLGPVLAGAACTPAQSEEQPDPSQQDGGAEDPGTEDGGKDDTGGGEDTGGGAMVQLQLPEQAHELVDLVCAASAEVALSWTVDGEPWTGDTATTTLAGDTVPAHALRAGQAWRCEAEDATAVETTVAPYSHPVLLEPVDAGPGDAVTLYYRGELLDQGTVYLDLGFDGWTDQGEATPHQARTERGDIEYLQRLELDAEGTVAFTIPDGVSGLHLSFWTDETPAEDEDELLWGLTTPALGPWLTVDPDGGLAVHFLSTARGPATVDLSWEGGSLQLTDDSSDQVHHLRLDGVPAGVDLDYALTEADGAASPGWTTHRVVPAAESLTVLLAADMQDNGADEQRWPEVAPAMAEAVPDADLMVLPGDLASDDRPALWWLYFHGGGELFASVPQVIAVGNHDTPTPASDPDTTSILRYFDPQGDGPGPEIGTVRYGPLEVVLLNSEVPEEWEADGAQYLWAEETLLEPTSAAFTITAFHRPAYDVGVRFAEEQYLFRELTSLFDGRVDLVLMGHEHVYQRYLPLQYDAELAPSERYGLGDGDGVAYMVLPAAGNRGYFDEVAGSDDPGGELRELLASPALDEDQVIVDFWHGFAEARIEPGRMELSTWKSTEDETAVVEAVVLSR